MIPWPMILFTSRRWKQALAPIRTGLATLRLEDFTYLRSRDRLTPATVLTTPISVKTRRKRSFFSTPRALRLVGIALRQTADYQPGE